MPDYPGKPPRLDQIFEDLPLYFITFNTMHRRSLLACDAVHDAFVAYAHRGLEMGTVEVGRYVLMPDHIHCFIRGRDFNPGLWVRGLKRSLSKVLPEDIEHWQPGFFDHILRSDESYEEKWNYVKQNPIRKGLILEGQRWPYEGEVIRIDRL